MRTLIAGSVLIAVAALASGCASEREAGSGTASGAHATKAGEMKAFALQADGHDVLHLMAPADTKFVSQDGALHLTWRKREVQVWLVQGATTLDEAVGRVSQQISSEFKDFKATSTSAVVVAGKPAKRMVGTGTEADDGDSGDADVIVFRVGERVFVACTHGETLSSASQEWMLAVLQSAQVP